MQKMDSFEIEGPRNEESDENSNKTNENFLRLAEKIPSADTFGVNEEIYAIRKSTMMKVSNLLENTQAIENEIKGDVESNANENTENNSKEINIGKKKLGKDFSYSDFEVGADNKRKITFDRNFEDQEKGKRLLARIKGKFKKFFDFPLLRMKFESSFVDVVITCNFPLLMTFFIIKYR